MAISEIPFATIGFFLIPVIWMWIGIGVSKMIGKIKSREISMFEVILWPIATVIFAMCDDIN
ncbi:hypothetical protein [Vibrio phage vB_VcM_SY]